MSKIDRKVILKSYPQVLQKLAHNALNDLVGTKQNMVAAKGLILFDIVESAVFFSCTDGYLVVLGSILSTVH